MPVLAQALNWIINGSVDIIATDSIGVYSDIDHTQELTTLSITGVHRGDTRLHQAYIVNMSDKIVNITANITVDGYTQELPLDVPSVGTFRFEPVAPFVLESGHHSSGWIIFRADPDAVLGATDFTIEIVGTEQ